jgi:hypothetical protein
VTVQSQAVATLSFLELCDVVGYEGYVAAYEET